jgi:inorganic pyrophosphatase
MQPERLAQIQHFFEHYKDLEAGKWVKVAGFGSADEAREEILAGVRNLEQKTAGAASVKSKTGKPKKSRK